VDSAPRNGRSNFEQVMTVVQARTISTTSRRRFRQCVKARYMLLSFLMACASPEPPTCELPSSESVAIPSGLCIAKNFTSVAGDPDTLAAAVADLKRLGAKTLRSDVLWHKVEPEQGVWEWDRYDALVDALEAADIELIALLAYGNSWASSQTASSSMYPPDDPADFANFAAEVAKRYQGRIRRFEIWNEPNAGRFWMPGLSGDPLGWAPLVLETEAALRAVDPSVEVILGGTFFHNQLIPGTVEFLGEAVEAYPELLERADAVAVHPYTLYPPRVPPESAEGKEIPLIEMIAQLREITGDLPVNISEFGWPAWGDLTQQDQAVFFERAALLAMSQEVTDVCWYTVWDGEDPENNPEAGFGLIDNSGVIKPVGDAFIALGERMALAEGAALVEGLPEGSYGVDLGAGGLAVWGEGEQCGVALGEEPQWFDAPE
jgi:polysaccharide biosynthesis protein PslG